MSQYSLEISKMLTEIDDRIECVKEIVRQAPKGRVGQIRQHKKEVLVFEKYKGNVRHRFNIKADDERIIPILKRDIFSKELDILLTNKAALEKAAGNVRDFDFVKEYYSATNRMTMLTDLTMDTILETEPSAAWEREAYEKCDYLPEKKIHSTSRGLAVRSKGEVIIAERLYQHKVAFRYEQVIRPDEASMLVPDFTIRRADGKIFYWEHLGMMSKKEYAEKQIRKMSAYYRLNIVPWDNLIVTYENADGSVDMKIVESEIINKLL